MASDTRSMPTTPAELHARIDANWFGLLVGVTTALVSLVTVFLFSQNPFYVNKDSALFQHAGWWITEGGRLYVDIWDLKPPLIYFVTTVLAVVSVGDMALLHVLSIALTVVVVVGGVILVGVLTHRLTDDGLLTTRYVCWLVPFDQSHTPWRQVYGYEATDDRLRIATEFGPDLVYDLDRIDDAERVVGILDDQVPRL